MARGSANSPLAAFDNVRELVAQTLASEARQWRYHNEAIILKSRQNSPVPVPSRRAASHPRRARLAIAKRISLATITNFCLTARAGIVVVAE